ncbi:Choline-phosphate cytidylyltransferase [Aphelenchoides bicaudatus]|nr:Choline-phosphate cytidylyltransferase [Aphelenchoides bicaudatus]
MGFKWELIESSASERAAFSDELSAVERVETLEPWKPRTLTEIFKRGEHLSGPPVRIYADGVFDLFHFGHAEQLRQVKQLIPNSYLVAGVCSDEDTRRYKNGSTVMNTEERCEILSHCRYVDEVHRNPPFFPTPEFIDSLKIDLVAHDSIPYQMDEENDDCYLPFKKADRFLVTQRAPRISTTSIIQRLVDNFEAFQERQAARGFAKLQ